MIRYEAWCGGDKATAKEGREMSKKRMVTVDEMFDSLQGQGMNESDRTIFVAVDAELTQASEAHTQRQAMEHLLFAKHLLETLLRQMQDS